MSRGYLLPALAVIGLAIAGVTVVIDNRSASTESSGAVPTAQAPYADYIAGAGIVEAGSGNIDVGTPVAGVVTDIHVKVGDRVKAGDPLFRIDDRDLRAALVSADARVDLAAAAMLQPEHQLAHAEQLRRKDPNAISQQDYDDLRDQAARARAEWALRKAEREQLKTNIARHTVRAPVAGQVLQLKMRLGEFVAASETAPPLLLLGSTTPLHVRVDIDEHDAWRFRPGTEAAAFVRGQPQLKVPLHYAYTEPYVVPKQSLTGSGTEKIDTRVLQVLYSLGETDFPVYAGQQLDVFVQVPADSDSGKAR